MKFHTWWELSVDGIGIDPEKVRAVPVKLNEATAVHRSVSKLCQYVRKARTAPTFFDLYSLNGAILGKVFLISVSQCLKARQIICKWRTTATFDKRVLVRVYSDYHLCLPLQYIETRQVGFRNQNSYALDSWIQISPVHGLHHNPLINMIKNRVYLLCTKLVKKAVESTGCFCKTNREQRKTNWNGQLKYDTQRDDRSDTNFKFIIYMFFHCTAHRNWTTEMRPRAALTLYILYIYI